VGSASTGHVGNHRDQNADEGYGELTDAIRETFMDESLVRKILGGVQRKDFLIISWLGEQGVNVYRRVEPTQPPVKSVLRRCLPPGKPEIKVLSMSQIEGADSQPVEQ